MSEAGGRLRLRAFEATQQWPELLEHMAAALEEGARLCEIQAIEWAAYALDAERAGIDRFGWDERNSAALQLARRLDALAEELRR